MDNVPIMSPDGPPPVARASVAMRVVRLAITVALLALMAAYIWPHRGDYRVVLRISPWSVLAVLVLDAMVYVYGAATIHFSVRVFGVKLRVWEAWQVSMVSRFCNFLTPFRGGVLARAVYLNRMHGLSYEHFVGGMSGMLLATVTVSVLSAIAGMAWVHLATGQTMLKQIVILAVVLVAILSVLLIRPRMAEKGGALRRRLARLVNGWSDFAGDRGALVGLMAVNALQLLTMAAMLALLLADMGHAVSFGLLLLLVALGTVSTLFQITPGGVGIYEGTVTVVGAMMGLSPANLLAAALTWRVLDAILVLATGYPCSHALAARSLGPDRPVWRPNDTGAASP